MTFDGSVRVPGTILAAGTYYFDAPQQNNRTIVRVSKEDGTFVTQFMGIADFAQQRDHDIIVFGDHECGPTAIKSWFYPGTRHGVRFVYSQDEAEVIAASCDEPVPEIHERTVSLPRIMVYRVFLMTPRKQEQEYAPDALSRSDAADKNGFHSTPVAPNEKGGLAPQ